MTQTDLDILAKKLADKLFQPRWLKLKQAAKYSSIGEKRLKALADEGEIIGYQDARTEKKIWRFDRYSIDDYMMEPVREFELKTEKILAKMRI